MYRLRGVRDVTLVSEVKEISRFSSAASCRVHNKPTEDCCDYSAVRRMSTAKIKQEERADDWDHDGTTEAGKAAEHRKRVTEMTAEMAADAGLGCSGRSDYERTSREKTTLARITVEPRGELGPPSMKTTRYDGNLWASFLFFFDQLFIYFLAITVHILEGKLLHNRKRNKH